MAERIVLTGATSFLGRYLVEELGKRGAQVYAVIRPQSRSKEMYAYTPWVKTVLADMNDVESWQQAIGEADYFLHFGWDGVGAAGRADVAIQEKNVADALNCLRGAQALGCKAFFFAGSQAEYGPQRDVITEQTSCAPVIEYGKAKLEVCRQATGIAGDMTYYHGRIFSVYGTGDHPWALTSSCIKTLMAGEEMKLSSGMQYWNYMFAPDAAYAICGLLLSGAEGGIYNIASRDTRRLRDFVHMIHAGCGGKGTLAFGTYDPSEKPVSLQPEIGKLHKAVPDIPLTPFADAITQMVNHYTVTGEI